MQYEKTYTAAFTVCMPLKSIKLPESLKAIGADAFSTTGESGTFQSCNQLQAVYISESVKYIDSDAFGMGATGGVFAVPMKTVYYGGNEEAWKKISIEKGNEKLTSAKLVFSAKPGDMAL